MSYVKKDFQKYKFHIMLHVENYFQKSNLRFADKILAFDFKLVFLILLLGIISLFAMYSSERGNVSYYTQSHLYRFSIFFLLFIIISFFKIQFWYKSAYLFYFIVLILLLAVHLFGITASGSKRWINLFIINLQPSELMKISLIVFVSFHKQEYYIFMLEKVMLKIL